MIRDRDYMRDPSGSTGRSLTMTLIVVLITLFVLQCCLMFYGGLPLDEWLGLSLHGIKQGHVWQLLTFQFMHSAPWPWHVLGNCLGLYFLGRSVEETLGKKKFLALYFGSGFLGGILHLLTTWILPHHDDVGVVGASAGVMGLLAVYATLFPLRQVTIFVMFFPVTLRVQYLFWFVFGLSAFGTLIPFDGIAHAAHLGGILFGLYYIRHGTDLAKNLSSLNPLRRRARAERMLKAVTAKPFQPRRVKSSETVELPPQEFISQEVDPILDKISAHGIQSLTDRERQILQAARNRMSKR